MISFPIFRYHYNSEETDISLLFLVISVAAYYLHAVSSASAPPVLFYKQVQTNLARDFITTPRDIISTPRDVISTPRDMSIIHRAIGWRGC